TPSPNPAPPPFPTRRSSDLPRRLGRIAQVLAQEPVGLSDLPELASRMGPAAQASAKALMNLVGDLNRRADPLLTSFLLDFALDRSEEHTSELQSRFDLVCRL